MADNPVDITLQGTSPLIENILKLKKLNYVKKDEDDRLCIKTKTFEVLGEDIIITYLDERHPMPQLISGDIENRARIRMIAKALQKYPIPCNDLANNADPYVFGEHITLVDLIVMEHTDNEEYKRRINRTIHAA